jgi:hypothetical protein
MLPISNTILYESVQRIIRDNSVNYAAYRNNIFVGDVRLDVNACDIGDDQYSRHDLKNGKLPCRGILFSFVNGSAYDLLNEGIIYRTATAITCKEDILPFVVEDYMSLEKVLSMNAADIDLTPFYNKQMTESERDRSKALIQEAMLIVERIKFYEQLTRGDIVAVQNIFLNPTNLAKLAILFGYKRNDGRGRLKNQITTGHDGNIGSLFKEGYFGELTPKQVFDILNKTSYNLSIYEKPKGMSKYIKGEQ